MMQEPFGAFIRREKKTQIKACASWHTRHPYMPPVCINDSRRVDFFLSKDPVFPSKL